MKKLLTILTLYFCFILVISLYSFNISTNYKIDSILYREEKTETNRSDDVKDSESTEKSNDPYKLNIGTSNSPVTNMDSSKTNEWIQSVNALGFRVSLVSAFGNQFGYSQDYYYEKSKTQNVYYNISGQKSKLTLDTSNIFNGYKEKGVSALDSYNNISKLPTGITLNYKNNSIDWSSVIKYFDSIVYDKEGNYNQTSIKLYVKQTFNRDLSNYCINDYYILVEPLI